MVVPPGLRMQFRDLLDYFARCGQRRIRFCDFLMCWTLIQQGLHLLATDLFSPVQLGDPPVVLNLGMQLFQGLLHVLVEVDDVCSLLLQQLLILLLKSLLHLLVHPTFEMSKLISPSPLRPLIIFLPSSVLSPPTPQPS